MAIAAASDERSACLKKKASVAASNWALTDATAPTTGDRILTRGPIRPQRETTPLEDDQIGGEYAQSGVTNGGRKCEFTVPTDLHYQATAEHLLMAMFFGTSGGSPSTPGGGTLTRDQYFALALNLDGLVGTFCEGATASQASDQPSALIVPSVMARSWKIMGEGDGLVTQEVGLVGIDAFLKPAPTTDPLPDGLSLNATLANIAAATYLSTGRRLRMGDLKFYIDDADGGDDFASNDDHVIQVGRFECAAERNLDYPVYGSSPASALDGEARPLMPVNNGQHVIPSIVFMQHRYADDELFGDSESRTPKRIRLEFTGAVIEGSLAQRFRIDLPNVILKSAPLDRAAGNIRRTLTGHCYKAASAPTGFSTTDPIRVFLRNQLTSDLLA